MLKRTSTQRHAQKKHNPTIPYSKRRKKEIVLILLQERQANGVTIITSRRYSVAGVVVLLITVRGLI